MYLIVGLGNPEKKYAGNRHNVGFQLANALASEHGFSPWRKKFHADICEGIIGSSKVLILKAQTFYNETGRAVTEAANFYKIPTDNIIALHDELDLAPSKLKVKRGGGAAGNNGLKSITSHMGGDFRRVRIGIGHPGDKNKVTSYVLSDFSKVEKDEWVDDTLSAAARAFPILLDGAADAEGRFLSDIAIRLGKNTRPQQTASQPSEKPKPEITKPSLAIDAKKEGPLAGLLRSVLGRDDKNQK